jgi:hypothetical protein
VLSVFLILNLDFFILKESDKCLADVPAATCTGAEPLVINSTVSGNFKQGGQYTADGTKACTAMLNYSSALWYAYSAPSDGCFTADLDTDVYATIAVSRGSACISLECVQIGGSYGKSKTVWKAMADEIYYVTVATNDETVSSMDFTLQVYVSYHVSFNTSCFPYPIPHNLWFYRKRHAQKMGNAIRQGLFLQFHLLKHLLLLCQSPLPALIEMA